MATDTQVFVSTVHTFRKINPSKKFSSFEWYAITDIKDFSGYLFKDAVVKWRDKFYMYGGSKEWQTIQESPSKITIKDGNTIIANFPY